MSQSRQVDPRARRRPAPPPKEADDHLVTALGTVGWAIALVVLLAVRSALPEGERWWLWTCIAGLAMGLFALWYVPFLKRKRARDEARRVQAVPGSRDSGSNTVSSTETPGSSSRS